ncbi:MAG: 16S rRNA (cytidine(1402)-2'-O)-methyltransferase [Candidatus Gracilibacteria bacterium]|nr:16S rRNA (cytidine(1402)-2'-O)-methyltransferase [Candidatus Gracilibacteria bacterium]
MLYIVSTPIGNLEDITFRAVRILKEVDYIACEDTRTSGVLLKHYEIKNNLISFHSYSDDKKLDQIINLLREGKDIALISDAGTPGISDPAYNLVKRVIEENITVCPIPGASALLSGLVASGMHTHDFRYLGFLPIKKGRQTLFLSLQNKDYTVIIYESVHRLLKTLDDLEKYFGPEYKIVVARELTKKFEEFKRGTVTECKEHFKKQGLKGEFVIIF